MASNVKDVTEKDFASFSEIPVIDCHTHVWNVKEIFQVVEIEKRYGIDKINVLGITSYDEKCMANNAIVLLFKHLFPGQVYGFGSLNYPLTGAPEDGEGFFEQVKRLQAAGVDGMKMMEGKPDTRKRIGIPLNSPIYDKYYGYLEAERIPLLYHVADPSSFWDKDKAPQFAVDNGWAYIDDTFVSKETLYKEIEGILIKFPKLKLILAHFYFMEDEGIKRASEFLDNWPEVSFDIAPGEMFKIFNSDLKVWKEFFIKYQDRIIFGTDNDYGMAKELIYTSRTILETDNEIEFWDMTLRGMHLDREVVEKIYFKNFQRYVGKVPKKVDTELLKKECCIIADMAQKSPLKENILQDVQDILNQLAQ